MVMSFQPLKKSFSHALSGLQTVFRTERNFRIHTAFGLFVILSFYLFHFERWEKVTLLILVGLVLVLELLNTAFEKSLDIFKPRLSEPVKIVKDILAAAVLIASLLSLVAGVIIYLPHIFVFLG